MTAAELAALTRDPKLKPNGGFMVHCPGPAHKNGDRRRSLSIDDAHNGGAVLNCFAGDTAESIMAAWGLTLADLMPGPRADRRGRPSVRTLALAAPTPARHDLALLAKQFQTAINPLRLERFAAGLGLSVESLRRQGIGWAADFSAWAWPMSDAGGDVRGIRLRGIDGKKFAVRGGREGLFISSGLRDASELLIAEGASDTAALLDLGFDAIGRPSCAGGVGLLADFVQARKHSGVVIVADADEPGQRGAEALASVLALYTRRLRIIRPPAGMKDARLWKLAGATAADVQAAIDAATVRKLSVTIQGGCHAR